MYWPFSTPTLLASSEDGQQVQSLAFSRTADLFLALSYTQLDLFNAKVRFIIADSRQSLERAGSDLSFLLVGRSAARSPPQQGSKDAQRYRRRGPLQAGLVLLGRPSRLRSRKLPLDLLVSSRLKCVDSLVYVLQTDKHYLLVYHLEAAAAPYEYIPPSIRHVDSFSPGPGEGSYLAGWNLKFLSSTFIPGASRCIPFAQP